MLPAGPLPELAARLERGLGSALGALELVSGAALRLTVQHLDGVADPFPGQSAELCCWSRPRARTRRACCWTCSATWRTWSTDAVVLPPARAWGLRHGVSEALALAGPVLGLDVSVPRATLEAVRTGAPTSYGVGCPVRCSPTSVTWGTAGCT